MGADLFLTYKSVYAKIDRLTFISIYKVYKYKCIHLKEIKGLQLMHHFSSGT